VNILPRTYKNKNIHTKPETAGEHNIPEGYVEKRQMDAEGQELMATLSDMYKKSTEKRLRKSAWTPELLDKEVNEYFEYCTVKNLKPSKSSLQIWLGVGKSQYYDWEQNKNYKYGDISEIINQANYIMETQYVNRAEKYPTANIFLMKTSHGHIESSKMDITSNGNSLSVDFNELKEKIAQLGLDKTE
jgi:hypothetical protein